jgi:hypothetical protein
MRNVIGGLVVTDGLLLAIAWWMGGAWIANTQVAFVTSALVMGASMFGYARMVQSRLESGAIPDRDDRDMIDTMEDPYGVYDDTVLAETPIEADSSEIKAAIQEEKQRAKEQKRTPMQTLRDSRAAMSVYRLGAYGALLFGFFYLRGNQFFAPMPYLLGLGLPIVVIVATLMMKREDTSG